MRIPEKFLHDSNAFAPMILRFFGRVSNPMKQEQFLYVNSPISMIESGTFRFTVSPKNDHFGIIVRFPLITSVLWKPMQKPNADSPMNVTLDPILMFPLNPLQSKNA